MPHRTVALDPAKRRADRFQPFTNDSTGWSIATADMRGAAAFLEKDGELRI
ncbi:hypothetical protein [Sphingomonas aerolata]|uniref:hypothetical protein n=1 Tax=Sphingomonas aerolata TaxID=185951 RepID=UPI002FDF5D89